MRPVHILILILVILLLFGAKKLPEIAGSLGKSAKVFKKEIKELQDDDEPAQVHGVPSQQPYGAGAPPQQGQYAQPQQYAQQNQYPPQQSQYGQPQQYAQPQGQYPQQNQYPPQQGQYGQPQQYGADGTGGTGAADGSVPPSSGSTSAGSSQA